MSANATAYSPTRLRAVDWLRGLVMIVMTTDHAGDAFDRGHLMTDSVNMYRVGMSLPADHFMARWVTHLCAPTFVFLSGVALALSVGKRMAKGESAFSIDRFIAARGLFILLLDPLWMSRVFTPGAFLCQVMYAIGGSMIVMCAVRRLPDRALLVLALALIFGSEAIVGLAMHLTSETPPIPVALLITGGFFRSPPLIVGYPLLSWLAIMMFGWWFGRVMTKTSAETLERRLMFGGVVSLALFVVFRGANAYGNMMLYREGTSLVQWLHVSKYPPSLTFVTLELGIMALLLAAFMRIDRGGKATWTKPLTVFGQTALFFYLMHAHLLHWAAKLLGIEKQAGLPATYVATVAVLLVLYPACVWYGRYKQARPSSWTRLL